MMIVSREGRKVDYWAIVVWCLLLIFIGINPLFVLFTMHVPYKRRVRKQ
jgi:hypothetical protein